MDVLAETNEGRLAHCLLGFATEILCNSVGDLFRQPGLATWLEQRQVVKTIALIVDHDIAVNVFMRGEPVQHLFTAANPRQVRAYIGEGDAVELRGKKPDRIGPPCRGENNFCAGACQQILQDREEVWVYDVGELAWIEGVVGVQSPIDDHHGAEVCV